MKFKLVQTINGGPSHGEVFSQYDGGNMGWDSAADFMKHLRRQHSECPNPRKTLTDDGYIEVAECGEWITTVTVAA